MEQIKCWNFLVSCNESLEYGSVITPDFIVDEQLSTNSDEFDLIGRSAGGKPTEDGQAIYRLVHSHSFGDLTLVFRVRECDKNVVKDNQDDGILKIRDRRVLLILGFIYQGFLNKDDIKISQKVFDDIYKEIKPAYRIFWNKWTRRTKEKPAIASKEKTLDFTNDGKFLEIVEDEKKSCQPPSDKIRLIKTTGESPKDQQIVDHNESTFKTSPNGLKWQKQKVLIQEIEEIVSAAYLSEDIIVYNFQQTGMIYKVKEEQKIEVFKEDLIIKQGYCFTPIAINTDGKLATGIMPKGKLEENYIRIWPNEGKIIKDIYVSNNLSSRISNSSGEDFGFNGIRLLAFTPMNTILACRGVNREITIFDFQDCHVDIENSSYTTTISVDHKNNRFASGNIYGDIIIWKLDQGGISATQEKTIRKAHGTHGSPVRALSFSHDGTNLASAGDDYFIKLWDPSTGKPTKPEDLGDQGCCINTLVFNPTDNNELASGDDNGLIKIWNISDGTSQQLTDHQDAAITSLSFSPDGKSLVSGSKDKTIRLWKKL